MTRNAVMHSVRMSNLNLIIVGLTLVVLLITALIANRPYMASFFFGPRFILNSELASIKDVTSVERNWVTVSGDKGFDTGWQHTSSTNGIRTSTDSYVALVVSDKLLLVEVPGDIGNNDPAKTYSGALVPMTVSINDKIMGSIRKEAPDVADYFLPFMLDSSDYRSSGYIGFAIGGAAALIALACLFFGIDRSMEPLVHPIFKALARFGEPKTVAEEINQEMSAAHNKIGSTHVTPRWVINQTMGKFEVTRLEDVVWIYGQVTQHRTNGIPTGKSYMGNLWDKHGKLIRLRGNKKQVEAALQAVVTGMPQGAFFGYDAKLEQFWKNNRAEFLAAVEQRRQT